MLIWSPSASCCPQPTHTPAGQEGPGYSAVKTERRSYKTIWSADKMHGTEAARERGTCGIIQNYLKPPHHLQALFMCLLPPSLPSDSLQSYPFLPASGPLFLSSPIFSCQHTTLLSLSTHHCLIWAPHTPY